jgi:hypothetical protein
LSSGSLEDLPARIHVTRFNCISFTVLSHPTGPTIRTPATVTLVPSNPITFLDGMTTQSSGIELGGDLPVVVEPIRCPESPANMTVNDFVFEVR